MSLFPPQDTSGLYFSMNDVEETPWSRLQVKPFELDGKQWQSAEHYYQAMKSNSPAYQERVRLAATVKKATKLGKSWFIRKRPDWKAVQSTVMTRAVYTQCRTYSDMAESLLETGDEKIVENSQFDYYWGCGRDRRGENEYGKMLMNIRDKLKAEKDVV